MSRGFVKLAKESYYLSFYLTYQKIYNRRTIYNLVYLYCSLGLVDSFYSQNIFSQIGGNFSPLPFKILLRLMYQQFVKTYYIELNYLQIFQYLSMIRNKLNYMVSKLQFEHIVLKEYNLGVSKSISCKFYLYYNNQNHLVEFNSFFLFF